MLPSRTRFIVIAGIALSCSIRMPARGFPKASVIVAAGMSPQAIALPSSTADFAVHLQAVFSQDPDQGIAITSGSRQNPDEFAISVRAFGSTVQVRGPNGYPEKGFPYLPSVPTDLIITGNVAEGIFSAWIASPGQPFTRIANDVGFRMGVQSTSLDTVMVWSDSGTIAVHLIDGSCVATIYDAAVAADQPVAFWDMSTDGSTEPDLSGHGNTGTYQGESRGLARMPNGDLATIFNGTTQYLSVPSHPSLSITTTGSLTVELWIRPTTLQFDNSSSDGYVDVMGKCAMYSPSCEWETRLYNTQNPQGRCNRISAYAFNPTAGLGSGADWQPTCGLLQAGQWLHIVAEYTTATQPSGCPNTLTYPGSIDIWVNGVKWNQSAHNPTGCMSQYSVVPQANDSPLNIGTMAYDTWFQGAIGKVAIYSYLLSQAQVTNHFEAMTGQTPTGKCANTCSF